MIASPSPKSQSGLVCTVHLAPATQVCPGHASSQLSLLLVRQPVVATSERVEQTMGAVGALQVEHNTGDAYCSSFFSVQQTHGFFWLTAGQLGFWHWQRWTHVRLISYFSVSLVVCICIHDGDHVRVKGGSAHLLEQTQQRMGLFAWRNSGGIWMV